MKKTKANIKKKYNAKQNHTGVSELNSIKAWLILSCAWAFYLYEYVLRVSPSVLTDSLMSDFGVTSGALGSLTAFYYLAYVPLQIPCGVIVDKLGPRKVIVTSALLCVLGCCVFAKSHNLFFTQMGRLLIGAGSACAYLSCTKVGSEWFTAGKFAMIAGLTQMMGTLGGICGEKPFAVLANCLGWRDSMLFAAVTGIIVAVVAWLFIKERSENISHHQIQLDQKEKEKIKTSLLAGLKIIVRNPQNWLIGLYGCMMYLPLSAFAELWGVPFVMNKYNISNEKAALASIMVFIGMAMGSAGSAWLSNKMESRVKVMSISAVGTLVFFTLAIYLPDISLNLMFTLLFVGGVFNGGQILYFTVAKEISPPETSGTTIGFTNCLVMVSGLVFQPLLGRLIDCSWDGQLRDVGTPLYSVYDYKFALSAMIVALIIGLIILRFVEETFDKDDK